jgi:DNA-binding response OmpR family regulator
VRATQLEGHEVRVAHDGAGALATLESFTPEVALLDIGLPEESGYELAQRLRSREAGFDHHLTKPIDLETLERLLRR